jgi:hypothetical protein
MVARLKLKEIDGRAPQGVNIDIAKLLLHAISKVTNRSDSAPKSTPRGRWCA